MVLNVHRNHKAYLGRREWRVGGGGGYGCGEKEESIYLPLHCHHQNDSFIKTGAAMKAI